MVQCNARPLFVGDITSIVAGNGLMGGGMGGDVAIDIDFSSVQKRASSSSMMCPKGRYVHGIFENGTVMCDVTKTMEET